MWTGVCWRLNLTKAYHDCPYCHWIWVWAPVVTVLVVDIAVTKIWDSILLYIVYFPSLSLCVTWLLSIPVSSHHQGATVGEIGEIHPTWVVMRMFPFWDHLWWPHTWYTTQHVMQPKLAISMDVLIADHVRWWKISFMWGLFTVEGVKWNGDGWQSVPSKWTCQGSWVSQGVLLLIQVVLSIWCSRLSQQCQDILDYWWNLPLGIASVVNR